MRTAWARHLWSKNGAKRRPIDDATIDRWVKGLPEAEVIYIISLLGRKKDDFSEFHYYPFRSSKECGTEPTFQEWLDDRYGMRFVVCEFPTTDAEEISADVLDTVSSHVLDLIEKNHTVVVVDSAGAKRSARVCKKTGYKK